jgi:GNAT superfamily N-acetyltransferase
MRELVFAGRVPGLLARVDGRAIGWCGVGRLREFPQYDVALSAGSGAWGIVCVHVRREPRGSGVRRVLIEGAVAYATAGGASIIHGPPPWWDAGGESAAATAAAFVAAGFRICGEGARMPQLEFRVER